MIKLTRIEDVRAYVKVAKAEGKSIGFVPTMGFLHQGHLALMSRAKAENDLVITSIYVNPTQFGPGEDYEVYPRDEARDIDLMKSVSVDACFFPTNQVMYPSGFQTYIETQGQLVKGLCGSKREGHFRGVTTIVGKLFNIVAPDRAYFGQKDAQQVAVIKQMVKDLDFGLEIIACPIVREADGLAMSSRNKYLGQDARSQALVLKASLDEAKKHIDQGERDASCLLKVMQGVIQEAPLARVDYIEIVDGMSLEPLTHLKGQVLMAMAVFVDGTRLLDNMSVEV